MEKFSVSLLQVLTGEDRVNSWRCFETQNFGTTCSSTKPQSLKRHLANFINKLKLSRQIFYFGILHQINGQFVSFNSRELKMPLTSPALGLSSSPFQSKVQQLLAFLANDWLLVATLYVMPDHSVLKLNNIQLESGSVIS